MIRSAFGCLFTLIFLGIVFYFSWPLGLLFIALLLPGMRK